MTCTFKAQTWSHFGLRWMEMGASNADTWQSYLSNHIEAIITFYWAQIVSLLFQLNYLELCYSLSVSLCSIFLYHSSGQVYLCRLTGCQGDECAVSLLLPWQQARQVPHYQYDNRSRTNKDRRSEHTYRRFKKQRGCCCSLDVRLRWVLFSLIVVSNTE